MLPRCPSVARARFQYVHLSPCAQMLGCERVRSHFGHSHAYGGGGHSHAGDHGRAGGELRTHLTPINAAASPSGPRPPLALGLETARAVTNLSRALESHAEASVSAFVDTFDSVWYSGGQLWRPHDLVSGASGNAMEKGSSHSWTVSSAAEELTSMRARRAVPFVAKPALLSLQFGDERCALVKLLGSDGRERYLSLLRLDSLDSLAHDGWQIVRELVCSARTPVTASSNSEQAGAAMPSIRALLASYLQVEHGGGAADRALAENLFDERAGFVAVGSSEAYERPGEWTAPAGSLLEISLSSYLARIASQSPHPVEMSSHDAVVGIDLLPCHTAAAATVHVGATQPGDDGDGARCLHVDHLLLARSGGDGAWKIVSKTFAPRPWPSGGGEL